MKLLVSLPPAHAQLCLLQEIVIIWKYFKIIYEKYFILTYDKYFVIIYANIL